MKIAYKISLLFAVLISVSACKLDQNPTSAITVTDPKDIFVSYASAENFARGMSTYFRSTTYQKYTQTADIQGDLFNASRAFGNRGGAAHTMSSQFNAGDYDVREVWDGYYSGITEYNTYIHNIDNVIEVGKLSAAQVAKVQQWRGEAYFFRAYSYFELAKKFCDVYSSSSATSALGLPFVGEFDVNQKPARATLQATMDSIEIDINKAASLLAGVKGVVRATTPTIDAVRALQARFYLWVGQYDKAIEAADLLISSPTYALATTLNDMVNEFYLDKGPEDIMQLFASMTESPRSNAIFLGQPYQISGGVVYYTLPDFLPTKKLVEMYSPNDTRSKVFVAPSATAYEDKGYNIPSLVKYMGNPNLTSSPYNAYLNMPKIFRIAEMYLIKAEAEAVSGTGDPKATLNLLQAARGADLSNGTIEDVKTEWARETVGEGMRIECLKRWGDLFNSRPPQEQYVDFLTRGVGYTENVPVELKKYTWPIPTNDIVFNTNLVQNPGW